MLNLEELVQFAAYADFGTLTKAAEQLHISQPTITRTMRRVEESFGVQLFCRSKNKIALTPTGERALELSRRLLADAENAVRQVQQFDKSLHTITVESCAPAPLWTLLPALSAAAPGRTIASVLSDNRLVLQHLGEATLGIVSFPASVPGWQSVPFLREALSVCVPEDHALAAYDSLTFAQMNGFNFLLYSEIGFWDAMCRENMPSSKFLVQTDEFAMQELILSSSLPCFVTNLSEDGKELTGRKCIPVMDPAANVTYYMLFPAGNACLAKLAKRLAI